MDDETMELPDTFYLPVPEGKTITSLFLDDNLRLEVAESIAEVDAAIASLMDADVPYVAFTDPVFGTVIHVYTRIRCAVEDWKDMDEAAAMLEKRRLAKLVSGRKGGNNKKLTMH